SSGGSAAFLGIPFAQAPVGELRFAAPVPIEPWDGVRDALEYGPTPLRLETPGGMIPEPAIPGESTLNLNLFTPRPGESDAGLPQARGLTAVPTVVTGGSWRACRDGSGSMDSGGSTARRRIEACSTGSPVSSGCRRTAASSAATPRA